MKTTVEIDATPQELRILLGLPDVEHLQEEMLEKIRSKMFESIDSNDPVSLMKLFMPMPDQMQSLQPLMESFWKTIGKSMDLSGSEKKETK
jgi:hypothetical protein